MKSRPILFSPAMVSAILSGTKTQTRRIVTPQFRVLHATYPDGSISTNRIFEKGDGRIHCPYGQSGHSLWVRETYYQRGHWEPIPGKLTKGSKQKWQFIPADDVILFTPPAFFRKGRHHQDPATPAWHKRLARFMPRKYSRLTLAVTGIRVQRLQDICREDSIAEGIENYTADNESWFKIYDKSNQTRTLMARKSYQSLWESINGPDSWQENPYIWVITFQPIITP